MGITVLTRSVLNDCKDICERLVMKRAICNEYIEVRGVNLLLRFISITFLFPFRYHRKPCKTTLVPFDIII